jgi:hypothetical protein
MKCSTASMATPSMPSAAPPDIRPLSPPRLPRVLLRISPPSSFSGLNMRISLYEMAVDQRVAVNRFSPKLIDSPFSKKVDW